MANSYIKYLIESSIYLGLFLLIYKWFISNLTHFAWMRIYLLSSLLLCVVLPFITLPGNWSTAIFGDSLIGQPLSFSLFNPSASSPGIQDAVAQQPQSMNSRGIVLFLFGIVYLIGASYRFSILLQSVIRIRKNIRNNDKIKEGRFWIINVRKQVPASSFLNFIFINSETERLTPEEVQIIKSHEQLHARQYHSIDTVIVELYSIVFWLNPLVKYLKNRIAEVHEYLADEKMCSDNSSKKEYSNLLLGLTCEIKACGLTSGFSGKQICRRVQMLTKSRSANLSKLSFLIILPVAVSLLLSFSLVDFNASSDYQEGPNYNQSKIITWNKVGNITWEGNTVYSVAKLNRVLGLKKGDPYSKEIMEIRLHQADDGISSLYLDNGYIFFQGEFTVKETADSFVDLTIKISEGKRARIGEIRIKGNGDVPAKEVLNRIKFKTGDWFSRKNIILSIRSIADMNKFDPEKIMPIPIPKGWNDKSEYATVDMEFEVTRK